MQEKLKALYKLQLVTSEIDRIRIIRGELPEEWKPVFDCAMQIRAIAGRLPDIDLQIQMRLEQERDMAMEQIKSNNRGQNAQAAKYYSAMVGGAAPRPGRFGSA